MNARLSDVTANGIRFSCFVEGEGPLVLMLHGFPDTPHTWDRARPAVAAMGFRVVAPFMRGYAPTEIPEDGKYDADTLGRDALSLIEAFGESEAIVIGHDWGATAAFSAVGLAPEKVRFLVTIALPQPASILPTPGILWMVRHFVTLRFPGAAQKIRDGNYAYIDELVQRWSPAWNVPEGETDAVKRSFATPGCLEAALGYYRAITPFLPASQKRKVPVPAVGFAGLDDNLPATAYDRARKRYLASYEVVKMRGGHFMHREHPEQFVAELTRVLQPYR